MQPKESVVSRSFTAATPATPNDTGRWSPQVVRWLAALLAAAMVTDFLATAPLVVMPQFLEHFQTTQAGWISAVIFLAGAVWAPLLGRLADAYGTRKVLAIAILVATLGSLIPMIAPHFGLLMVGRALQGTVASIAFLSVTLIRQTFPPRTAATAIGLAAAGSGVLGLIPPILTGLAVAQFGFSSVFWLPAAFGMISAVSVWLLLPEGASRSVTRIDYVGVAFFGLGVSLTLAYVSLGPEWGWASPGSLALLLGGLLLLVLWLVQGFRASEPFIDPRTLRGPLALVILTTMFVLGAYQTILLLMSLIAQVPAGQGLGYGLDATPETVSLFLVAPSAGLLVGGVLSGWISNRWRPSVALLVGATTGAIGSWLILLVTSSAFGFFVVLVVLGIAVGAVMSSAFNLAVVLATPDRQATTASLVTIATSVAGVTYSVAVMAMLNSSASQDGGGVVYTEGGITLAFVLTAVGFVAATVFAFFIARVRVRTSQPGDLVS